MQPDPDSLVAAIRRLDTERIQAKLASGELTPQARVIALAELDRRQREGDEPDLPAPSYEGAEPGGGAWRVPSAGPLMGWSIARWVVVYAVCLVVALMFGTNTRNPNDRSFLLAVVGVQALVATGVLRAITAALAFESLSGSLAKLLVAGALCVMLFGLVLCSSMARTGWLGG